MKNNKKRGFSVWWIIIIVIIIVLGILGGVFWKSNPKTVNEYIDNVIDSVKEIIGVQDSPEQLKNDSIPQNKSNQPTEESQNPSISGGGGGGGGGGGAGSSSEELPSNITTPIEEYFEPQTFLSLEELFDTPNPVGNRVSLRGIAIQVSGASTSEYFFFTDDSRVMENPNYLLVNRIDYHITVYNSLNVEIPQSIIDLTGTIIECGQANQGTYCVNAETIE